MVRNLTSGEEEVQPSEGYAYLNDDLPNFRWHKIYRHKNLNLERKSGRDFILLKRRTWGTRCETAWDPILFQQTDNVCSDCNCWGTGWREGYFTPQKFKGMLNPTPQSAQISMWGEWYPSDTLLYMLNRPPLEKGDVIVDPQVDKRYYVQRARYIELDGKPIEQQAQLSLIHIDDEIYDYNIESYI